MDDPRLDLVNVAPPLDARVRIVLEQPRERRDGSARGSTRRS